MAEKPYTVNATRRPDGTWRKERRVKEGYVPPDEAVKFESKGTKFMKSIPKVPPGMNPVEDKPKLTKNQKKNERKKQKRKEKAEGNIESIDESVKNLNVSESKELCEETKNTVSNICDKNVNDNIDIDSVENIKRAKALRKKLKQIKELENKKLNGEIKEYAPDQLEKIAKKSAFEKELRDLDNRLA